MIKGNNNDDDHHQIATCYCSCFYAVQEIHIELNPSAERINALM